jgi:ferredoxin
MLITEECINCNACIDECPNNAIFTAGEEYTIDGQTFAPLNEDYSFIVNDLCKKCEGYAPTPCCIDACPTGAVIDN